LSEKFLPQKHNQIMEKVNFWEYWFRSFSIFVRQPLTPIPMKVLTGFLIALLLAGFLAVLPTQAQSNCSPAYPDVCIAPPPPDLDCADIPHRNFRVLPPDPHRFDGDRDGIGCEG
jgi:hypothetical protein